MNVLFDTSVLVAALVTAHPQHALAFPWLRRAHDGKIGAAVASHTLAELYATLTSLPHRPRIGPEIAHQVIRESVLSRFRVIALGTRDYERTLKALSEASLPGGIVYDALAARAAEKAGADRILTFNERDYVRLATVFRTAIEVPS